MCGHFHTYLVTFLQNGTMLGSNSSLHTEFIQSKSHNKMKIKQVLLRLYHRLRLPWLGGLLIHPRRTLSEIAGSIEGVWLIPLILLSISAIGLVFSQGQIRQKAILAGEINYPPGFEYYTPEQQAQFLKAAQATSSPTFIYVIPGAGALTGVWLGWMVVSGILHLIMTLLGGRGTTTATLNLVAWSSLPFVLRDLVRIFYVRSTQSQIQASGISGLINPSESTWTIFLAAFLSAIDIYLIWQVGLLTIGFNQATRLSARKVILGVVLTILQVISFQALLGFLSAQISSLTVIRPFMF
jgi:hypothetical protein